MSARYPPSTHQQQARNDGGPPPGYGRERSPAHAASSGAGGHYRPSSTFGRPGEREGEPSSRYAAAGGRDDYYRSAAGSRGGYADDDERDRRSGGRYAAPSRERDYGRPSTREAFDAPSYGGRGAPPPPSRGLDREPPSRRSRSPPPFAGGGAPPRRRSRSPPPPRRPYEYDRYPPASSPSLNAPPPSAARLKGDSVAPPVSAARLKGDSAPARRPVSPPRAEKQRSRTPPPAGQVEGVDGEWVEDDGDEYGDGLEDGEEDEMAKMMGFGGFGSSKGKHVPTNVTGAVQLHKPRTWRQYMNRAGGFNRPLAKTK